MTSQTEDVAAIKQLAEDWYAGWLAGDLGYFWSTYALTATSKTGGELLEDEGKSVFIARRQTEGSWKIARLIANSDRLPPSGS